MGKDATKTRGVVITGKRLDDVVIQEPNSAHLNNGGRGREGEGKEGGGGGGGEEEEGRERKGGRDK